MHTDDFKKLKIKDVFDQVSQETLWEYYLNTKISLNLKYTNPLREDTTPDCTFHYYNEYLVFTDWARNEVYNIFQFLQQLYSLNLVESIEKVEIDFKLSKKSTSNIFLQNIKAETQKRLKKSNKITEINAFVSKDKTQHLDYFSTFDFKPSLQDLYKYRVIPISRFELVFDNYGSSKKTDLGFCYFLQPNSKVYKQIYNPFFDSKFKFRQLMDDRLIGLEFCNTDKNYIVITKSFKDMVILQWAGINSCAIISESYTLSSTDLMNLIKYKKVYVLFDNDLTGKKRSNEMNKSFGFTELFYTDVNDTFEYYKNYGIKKLNKYINNFL